MASVAQARDLHCAPVLHHAGADIRAPTHELTIARDVLRSRRRITAQPAGWALGLDGLRWLRGQGAGSNDCDEVQGPAIAVVGQPAAPVAANAAGAEGG
jgi:hypothetical protein